MTDDSEVARIAAGLTKAQRDRLIVWPNGESSLFRNGPDAVARDLCDLGIGVMRPWKHGQQMALTSSFGPAVRARLQSKAAIPPP